MNALTAKPHCFRSVSRTAAFFNKQESNLLKRDSKEEAERSIGVLTHKYTEHNVHSGI